MARQLRSVPYGDPELSGGGVEYIIFEPHRLNTSHPFCVFSTIKRDATSGINAAEKIIDAICAKEGADWKTLSYAEVVTHCGYNRTPGYYDYHLVKPGNEERCAFARRGGCHTIASWQDVECPIEVFKAFEHLIGKFPPFSSFINRSEEAYRDYSDEQIQADREWAEEHLAWMQKWSEVTRTQYSEIVMTPQQAKKLGYVHFPSAERKIYVEKPSQNGVWVDLQNSHLLGQKTYFLYPDPLRRPEPFVLWEKKAA